MSMFHYITSPIDGEVVEIGGKLRIFSLTPFIGKVDTKGITFLKKMYKHSIPELRTDNLGSAMYFFKAGNSAIQLEVSISELVYIKPYLVYIPESVSDDLEKLITLSYLIHSTLKAVGLQ